MKLELIVIDMDDTVYLERDYIRSGFAAVGKFVQSATDASGFSNVAWDLFVQGTRNNTFDRALELLGLTGLLEIPDLIACYREHEPNIEMTDDAIQFLRDSKGRIPLALITDGPPTSQRNKIRALGLDRYLDEAIVTYEHDHSWRKPNDAAFLHLQEKFSANADGCIYVADNPVKDFHAPEHLGWRSLRIRRPGSLHQDLDSTVQELVSLPDRSWIDEQS